MLKSTLSIMFMILLSATTLFANWAPLNTDVNTPSYGTAEAMAVITWQGGPQYIFAADYDKGVCRSTDAGANWTWSSQLNNCVNANLIVANPYIEGHVYIVRETSGYEGFWVSTNSGNTWTENIQGLTNTNILSIYFDPNEDQNEVHAIYATCAYVSGDDEERIFKTTNEGASWSRALEDFEAYYDIAYQTRVDLDITSIYIEPEHEENIWLGNMQPVSFGIFPYDLVSKTGVWFTSDGGDTWEQQLGGDDYSYYWDNHIVYRIDGCIKIIENPMDSASPYAYAATKLHWDDLHVFAPPNRNVALMLKSNDEPPFFSYIWELQGDGASTFFSDFSNFSLIVDDNDLPYSILALNSDWHSYNPDLSVDFTLDMGVANYDITNNTWAGLNDGLYFPSAKCLAIDPSDYEEMYCGTDDYPFTGSNYRSFGAVYRTADWGENWIEVTKGMHCGATLDLDCSSGDFWAGGYQPDQEDNTHMVTKAIGGGMWSGRLSRGLYNRFRDIAVNSTGQNIAVASGDGDAGEDSIWFSNDFGETFFSEYGYIDGQIIGSIFDLAVDGSEFYATIDNGPKVVYRSGISGQWESFSTDWPGAMGNEAMAIEVSEGSGYVYAGTQSLGMYKSQTQTPSWASAGLNNGSTDIDNISVIAILSRSNVDTILAVGNNSGQPSQHRLLISTNGGTNWDFTETGLTYKDIRGIAVDPDHRNIVLASAMDGNDPYVYISMNYGHDWKDISTGLDPNIIHEVKDIVFGESDVMESNAIYVGTDNGLYQYNLIVQNDEITSDTTWTKDNVILVDSDITVEAGVTLTIEAGTIMLFSPRNDCMSGGTDANRCEIIVNGTLVADAFGDDAIEFKPCVNSASTDSASWYGIVCGSSGSVTLNNCKIAQSIYGVISSYGTLDIRHCSFERISSTAVYSAGTDNYAVVDSNEIQHCFIRAIDLSYGIGHDVIGNEISQCKNGIRYSATSATITPMEIRDNVIENVLYSSPENGIYYSTSAGTAAYITGNTISGFNQGMYLSYITNGGVSDNYSHDNSTYGAYINNSTVSFICNSGTKNEFSDNYIGISCNGSTTSLFTYNKAEGNSYYGVYAASASTPNFGIAGLTPGHNAIYSSGKYEFYRDGVMSPTVRAESCYWGGGAPAYFGNVDYTPYSTSNPLPRLESPSGARLPEDIALVKTYPNPFNPSATIEFSLPHAGAVRMEIYNIVGQKVKTLCDGYYNSGMHTLIWDGTNENGEQQTSGVYFATISGSGYKGTAKMTLLR